MGPRYLIPLLPFLSIGAAGLQFLPFRKNTILRHLALVIFILLIGYSSLMMLVATSVKPEVPINIHEPFTEFLLPAFYQGHLALNTQSIDSKFPVQGGPFVAWNLGHLIGFDGVQSLIPLGVVGIIFLGWLLYISRSGSNSSEEITSAQDQGSCAD